MEKVNTVVVGGGQAGIAMSEHLMNAKIPHVVLERGRIAERWRSERWDSLLANGPAWHDCLPGMEIPDVCPDDFTPKEKMADYISAYAKNFDAPVRCGVEVISVEKIPKQKGFEVNTSQGKFEAENIIAATGPFQRPVIPRLVPEEAGIVQLHSSKYKNPNQLPEGAVLVVGAGASGGQIADELNHAGRQVYLSIGRHDRPPRYYRKRDGAYWSGVLDTWDAVSPGINSENIAIAVSGVYKERSLDYRIMASEGMVLLGRADWYSDGKLYFANDLSENIELGNKTYLDILKLADKYIEYNGLDFPDDPDAHLIPPVSKYELDPIRVLELKSSGIRSIIWATGFTRDYSWIHLDVFDEGGYPIHQRGISTERGIYFLGLPFQSRRSSSFIFGVSQDARYLAEHIEIMQKYHNKDFDLRKLP
jgi:putative flavoprotein involved in K+ transport